MRRRALFGGMALAALLALADAPARADGGDAGETMVSAVLILPADVPAAEGRATLDVTVSLSNDGAEAATLRVPTPCDVHDWTLSDRDGHVVAERGPEICQQVIAEKTLSAGQTLTERRALRVPGGLRAGAAYRLDYRFWGVAASADFTAK